MSAKLLMAGRKRVLMVLFVPSVERDGTTPIDQAYWRDAVLELLGQVFGGATAYPKAIGIWRDDDRGGAQTSRRGAFHARLLTREAHPVLRGEASSYG